MLAKNNTSVFDTLARNLNKITVVSTENTSHRSRALQLLQVTFTEASDIAYGNHINAAPLQLACYLDIQVLVKIVAKDCGCQPLCPLIRELC